MPERRRGTTPRATTTTTPSTSPTPSKSSLTLRRSIVGVMSVVLGLSSLVTTQYVARHDMGPVLKACNSVSSSSSGHDDRDDLVQKGYHRYEPKLGGNVACTSTQFVHRLLFDNDESNDTDETTKDVHRRRLGPSSHYRLLGCMAWLVKLSLFLPAYALLSIESSSHVPNPAEKYDEGWWNYVNRPWFQQTSLLLVLSQLVGISTAFALVFLPSYLLSSTPSELLRSRISATAFDRHDRGANAGLISLVAFSIMAVMVLFLRPSSPHWSVAAGLAGGPALATVPIIARALLVDLPVALASRFFKNTPTAPSTINHAADATAAAAAWIRCYGASGAIAFCLWSVVLFGLFSTYAIHYQTLWNEIMASNGFVHHVLCDAAALYVGLLLYVSYHSMGTAVEAILQSLIFGPGAAVSMALAQLENHKGGRRGAHRSAAASTATTQPGRPPSAVTKTKTS